MDADEGDETKTGHCVEHLAFEAGGELLDFDFEIVHESLDLGAPLTVIRGGHLQGHDAIVALGADLLDTDGLQVGEAVLEICGRIGADGL